MAQTKVLVDEHGIINEACKILPDNSHKINFLEALGELEDIECYKSHIFPKALDALLYLISSIMKILRKVIRKIMEQIIIQIEDKFKAKLLVELLNDMNFVTDIKIIEQDIDKRYKIDFFSFAGIWADRDVNLQSIRQKAWPRQCL